MPSLNSLGLTNEKIGDVDFANMPEQRGGYTPPLPPGTYRFKLPTLTADSPVWDTINAQVGTRLNVTFEDAFALTVVQSPGGAHNGQTFTTRISAAERNRAKKGEPEVKVSDLDYLLRDALGETARPKTNLEYARALMKHSGEEFTADVEWSWYCNEKKNIYTDDGQGGSVEVEGTLGCGARYYQGGRTGVQKQPEDPNDPSSPQVYPERIICSGKDGVPCGASVRAFANLRTFRK